MPVIKSAKKKLRADKKRESANKKTESSIEIVIEKAQKQPTDGNIQKAFAAIDKGVKKNIYHKNKGSRIKSKLSKLVSKKSSAPKTRSMKTSGKKGKK